MDVRTALKAAKDILSREGSSVNTEQHPGTYCSCILPCTMAGRDPTPLGRSTLRRHWLGPNSLRRARSQPPSSCSSGTAVANSSGASISAPTCGLSPATPAASPTPALPEGSHHSHGAPERPPERRAGKKHGLPAGPATPHGPAPPPATKMATLPGSKMAEMPSTKTVETPTTKMAAGPPRALLAEVLADTDLASSRVGVT